MSVPMLEAKLPTSRILTELDDVRGPGGIPFSLLGKIIPQILFARGETIRVKNPFGARNHNMRAPLRRFRSDQDRSIAELIVHAQECVRKDVARSGGEEL